MKTDGENEPRPLTDQDFSILTQTPSQGVAVLVEMSMKWEDTHLQSTDAKTITSTLNQTTVIIVMDEDTIIHGQGTTRLACPRGEIAETIIVITITDMRRSTVDIIIVTMVIIIMVTMIIMIIGPRGIRKGFTDVIT